MSIATKCICGESELCVTENCFLKQVSEVPTLPNSEKKEEAEKELDHIPQQGKMAQPITECEQINIESINNIILNSKYLAKAKFDIKVMALQGEIKDKDYDDFIEWLKVKSIEVGIGRNHERYYEMEDLYYVDVNFNVSYPVGEQAEKELSEEEKRELAFKILNLAQNSRYAVDDIQGLLECYKITKQ